MIIKSTQKFIRTSPRKLRLVANAIKRLNPADALAKLRYVEKAAAEPLSKALKTAISNAKNNYKINDSDLKFDSILINPGPTLKRGRPVSRGQYHAIKKRMSHITIILNSTQDLKKGEKSL